MSVLKPETELGVHLCLRRLEGSTRISPEVYCARGIPRNARAGAYFREFAAPMLRLPRRPILARSFCRDIPTKHYNRMQSER